VSANLLYSFREGLEGLRRARLASFVAVSTTTLALVLMGAFLIITINLGKFVDGLRSKVEFEVFIDNSYDEAQARELGERLRAVPGVASVEFISKDAAAMEFQKTFGDNAFDLLDENPLPASFRVKLAKEYRTTRGAAGVAQAVSALEGVDEVVYRRDLLTLVEKYLHLAVAVDLTVGVLIAFGALLLVSNTTRLIILSKRDVIEVMKLVGATKAFIRRPFLIEGVVQGFLGGLAAAVLLFGAVRLIRMEIPGLVTAPKEIYAALILFGLVLGVIGSFVAVRKFL